MRVTSMERALALFNKLLYVSRNPWLASYIHLEDSNTELNLLFPCFATLVLAKLLCTKSINYIVN